MISAPGVQLNEVTPLIGRKIGENNVICGITGHYTR